MELTEEDRKKKLAAGREKLAAFRKKRARRRTQWDGGEGDKTCSIQHQSNGSPEAAMSEVLSATNDSNSITEESDQFSLTSGDEWSAEESELHSSVYYQTKLASATQRIAELEEALEGKQIALDRMVMEMQSYANTMSNKNEDDSGYLKGGCELRGSVTELKEALIQRDKIICQLTSHLQWKTTQGSDIVCTDTPDYMQEAQLLSHEVSVLQHQLSKAGETLRNQEAMCQASVQALQEAKEQILNLRVKITEKNDLLRHLSQNLSEKSADLLTLKTHECELMSLVKELQEQAAREAEARQMMSDTAQADANRVCLLEQELDVLTNQQDETFREMAELQEQLRKAEALCACLKEENKEGLEKIACLERELDRLVDGDRAFARLSDLDDKVQEHPAIIQTIQDHDLEYNDTSERVVELEREISDLSRDHRIYIDHLNQRNAELEMLLAENIIQSTGDMPDLKNKINSQQNEILALTSQLQAAEAENAFHKVQVVELQEQLEELQMKYTEEQGKHAETVGGCEKEIHLLQAENSQYKIKIISLEEEILILKQELSTSITMAENTGPEKWDAVKSGDRTNDSSEFVGSEAEHLAMLQKSYSNLETQFATLLQQNAQLQMDLSNFQDLKQKHEQQESTIRDLLSQVDHLQDTIEDWTLQVQEKNYQVENLQSQLTATMKEKEELVQQMYQQSEIVEKQTYSSDTHVRKLESCIGSLNSELSNFKEALKESESANIELQDKFDAVRAELEAAKSQIMASECKMAQLKSEWETEKDQLLKDLQQKAEKLQTATLEKINITAAAEDARVQQQQALRVLELQHAEILQQNQYLQSERDQLVVSHGDEISRLEENLKQKTEDLVNLSSSKNHIVLELAAVLDKQTTVQQQLEMKLQELMQAELTKKQLSEQLSCAEEEIARERSKFSEQLEQKTQELLLLTVENEKLAKDKELPWMQESTQLQDLRQQLEHKSEELSSVISEKEKISQELAALWQKQSTNMARLEEKTEDLLQTSSTEEKVTADWESIQSELNNQLPMGQKQLEGNMPACSEVLSAQRDPSTRKLDADSESKNSLEQLEQRDQQIQILVAENQRLHEHSNSSQSAAANNWHLHTVLKQKELELSVLMSEWETMEMHSLSRESVLSRSLKAVHQILKEKEALSNHQKVILQQLEASAETHQETVYKLNWELDKITQQLAISEQDKYDILQNKQREIEALESKMNQIVQDLISAREERDSRTVSLADQAEMFRAKEEEMVAENNSLNHQLEEVKNEAQRMAEQTRAEQESARVEMDNIRSKLLTKDVELQALKEDLCHQKNMFESQSASVINLNKEKDELILQISELEKEAAEIQNEYHTQCHALHAETGELKLELEQKSSKFEQEKQQLVENCILLKEQLESGTNELEQLQRDLAIKSKELETMAMDLDSLHHQKNTLQHEFSAELEGLHAKVACKEAEILGLNVQLKDSTEQLKQQMAVAQEEVATIQAEIDQKNIVVLTLQEELEEVKLQLEQTKEEKELLKNNFDCCMEDMTQRSAEQETIIKQLQSRLAEASHNVDRDQGQLREMYESQLSDLEDRLAIATAEVHRLENASTSFDAEKMNLKESYSSQIAELEVSLQSTELEQLRLKEQMSKMIEAHEKEILETKHSFEIQLATVEENCQSLEKALAKQDSLMVEAFNKFEQEKTEREKNFEVQMSDLYEMARIHETEVGRVRRQMDEMRRDHQKEKQDLQQALETHIFELENKCSIATCELDRMRSSLWTMEGDFSTERNSLQQKISELEDICLSREKQILELQDKLARMNTQSEENTSSLTETHQSEIHHLEEVNDHMAEDIRQLQEHLKAMQDTHRHEIQALKYQQCQEVSILQERCRQMEIHSQVLQCHLGSLSSQPAGIELPSAVSNRDNLQVDITLPEDNVVAFQKTLTEREQEISQLHSKVSILTLENDRKDTEIKNLSQDIENEKEKYEELQLLCTGLEHKTKQLLSDIQDRKVCGELTYEGRRDSPDGGTTAEYECKALVAESEHQNPDNFQLQDGDHSSCAPGPKELMHTLDSVCFSPERFEPEPDYPKYLDLATMTRKSSDYFVEEADTNAVGRPGGRPRIRSVSANMFVAEGFEPDVQSLPFTSSDYRKNLIRSEISEVMNQKERNTEAKATPSNAGCFEPEEENIQSQSVDFDAEDAEETSFQLESLQDMPSSEYSNFLVPDQSFLPFSLNACPSAPMLGKKLSKCVDSCTQTDGSPDDSFKILASNACSNMGKNNELNISGDKAIKNEHAESNLQTAELMETTAKETIEKELNRRLESMRDDLEEKWVQKMRSQEVELRHQHDVERIEYQTQLEQQCHQQVEALKHENHIAFIKAVRQMKKSLAQNKKHQRHTAEYQGKQPEKGLSEDWTDASSRTASQAADESLVEQLHKENQELAEVRDVLLEQIAISHTQGLRQTMQHELQSIVSECGKRLPSLSLKSIPSTDQEAEATSDSTHTVSGALSRHGRVAERIVSILHRGEIKKQMAAVFQELLSQQPRGTNSEESKTVFADDNDPGPVFEGESEASSAQELFLEELEEMSQQSGQDLPLEWELTSATVSQAGATTGDFDRDQMGTGSVWEVFDGRCLRQDCLELESIKQKHEAEMASLRQQLEEYRQISEKNHEQLQEQYLQAVTSLRNGLAQAQQGELDAVVRQLQELHEQQLKQLQAQHQHDLELEVVAVRVAVEQVQNARVHLIQEEHEKHLQHLKKEHKDQLNALHAELDNLHAGDRLLPLTASEELTRRYQQLIQKITKSLENQMLTFKHEDYVAKKAENKDQAEESGTPEGIITAQQAEAIQEALQAQQEEVLFLRSELLAEYEHLLQQRSAEATQQTQDILRLQEEMAALQQQYQKQINEFQARLSNLNEQKGMQGTDELQQDLELENVKATYEQRITDLEDSFTRQIAALQQTALNVPDDAIDCLTSQLAALDSTQHDSPLTSQRLVFVKDYVHKSTFIDGTCKVDADTTSSSWGLYGHEGSRLQELIKAVEEKNAQIIELEKHLYQERQNTEYLIEKLSKLEAELEEQKQMAEKVATILEERESQLKEAHQKAVESEKLFRELTEKEGSLKNEAHEDGLYGMQESDVGDSGFAASPSSMQEEVHKLKVALDQATISLRAVEQRECKLREQLEEIEHQHQEALEAVRQELEHEAQVERDSLQSEFQVQLEVELRRQAAELQRQFVEQTARTLGITGESCSAISAQEEESALSSTALETSAPPHFQTEETVQEAVFTHQACLTSHGAGSSRMSGEIPLSGIITEHISTDVSQTLVGADIDSSKEELKSDFNKQVEKLKQTFEAEKTQMSNTYLEQIERLQNQLLETEEKYNRLQEVIEEHEGAGVEQLLKDRYDMELELAKSLMQKEFDDTLAAEKKKFVERHRQLMDGFMSEQEAEAEKIKEQHQQDLNKLQSSFTVKYVTIIADLHGMIKEQRQELSVSDDECQEVSSEKELTKSKEEEKETNVKDDEYAESEDRDDLIASELHSLRLDLTELCQLVVRLKTKQQKAVDELRLQYEARLSELEAEHQDQLEAAALDTDVLKSELDCALAELESLRQTSQQTTQLKTEKMLSTGSATLNESSREALQSVSEISFALLPQFERASQSGKDGNQTPDIHSSLEYEETDEEGSLHSFSSLLGKTRSFANGVKTPLPSPEPEQRIKQLKAEIEQLTQELEQKQASILKDTTVLASSSSPPAEAAGRTGRSKESESLIAMLQSDLDRISAERDTIQQTNNRLLQLLSDSIHTYVEVEDRINRRLQTIVSASGPRPHSPCPLPLENHDNLLASGGAGAMASSYNVISKGAGIMSSPRSERSWQPGEADSSFTLEETSILSIATDEGLDVSQRLTDSIFTGPDIGAEGEEIVADARGRLQSAVSHLLDLIGQTTQQLMEAKKTQADLLESLAARSNDSNIMAARIQDLEEQFRQEVSAKEYFSLELHKAEGLIKGYSSEREAMEEQIQLLEEQKEVLAQSLETTRSQLQDFQDAAGELEARRQDVERHQILLQQNAGQEAQESSMTGGDTTKSEEQALLVEVNMVKQERREQTLQLQHRLDQTQQSLQDREATLEEMERVFQRQREEMREQLEDLRLQLENTERQLKSNKQFLDEQMNERELEREEFQREIEKLRQQVQDKDKQEGSHVSLHREIQDLTEHLHVRVEREAVMHQRMQELQQTLQDRDLSAQDLRIWITTLEKELDQQGDVEQQLKDRIQKLEQQLSQEDGDAQSVRSSSPVATPRPGSPGSLNLSLNQPTTQQAISYVSLEEELRKSRQAEEELTHEKEALKNTVQQQLLQISALRNQLDDLRHWRGPPEPSSTTSTTANLRDELESEREEVQKKEEKIIELKSTQENLEKQLAVKQRELEQLTKHLEEMQHKFVSVDHIVELERERDSLKSRVGELSAAHAFPPALLEEKNAEIDELRLQLNKTEAHLKEKEELISDLQDTMLSLQRGETCLDVSLPFNEPVSLNASFTERLFAFQPPAVVEQPSLLTTLAQELDQTVSERETEVAELTTQVDRLTREVMHVKEQLQEAVAALHQKEEDLSQLQEEKVQKQEAMVEKDSRLEQLMVQVKSLQTEITSLTAFQMELQKDYDTVQNMLEEKEQEIESLTREYLETRSQPDGSDVAELETELVVAQKKLQEQGNIIEEKEEELYELRDQLEAMDSLKEEVKSLSAILAEKEVELQKVKKLHAEAQRELKELQVTRHDHADHPPDDALRSLEEQISKLKAEVHHLEESVKDKEEFIRNLEEEKSSELDSYEKESAAIRLHLTEALNEQTTKVTQLEIQLADKACSLQQAESIRDQVLQAKEKEATIFHETLQSKTEIIEKLENEVMSLQHQITEKDLCITELKVKSQELQDQVKEMSHLEEQLHQLSSVPKNAATDEGKALQNELAQASEKLITLTQQLTETQIHLEQTSSQLAEKRDHIQQLQAEIQTLQLQAHHQHAEDKELNVTPESFSYLKTQESSDDGELHDDGLKDFLAKAQQMQMTVNESLSASLPMSSEMSRLSRWDSEPGLSSTYPTELVSLTFGTETWMRRQQKEMAAKNRELALLREELEGWLRRKGTSRDSTISTSTLQKLHEKESLIISLKRELIETKALLVSAEKRAAETSDNFFSMELTPQTKQQIAHLRSELRLAKAALTALQKHSQRDGLTSDVDKEASHEEQDRSQKLEAEHQLHKSSAIVSTKDFLQKVQELREEITLEHQKHIQDIQEAARQDAEMKMTEMQVRHDHEVQQLRSHHERKLEQALTHQQQELEKQHKTELNSLRVQHQQEIDRLRSEELASLTDGSVVSRLRADVGETQQMDEHLIGSFALRADGSSQDDLSTAETSSIMSGSEEALPSRLQALLTRLRQAGDHILSISELNFLLQHLTPQGEVSCQTLQEAFEGEKSSLVKTANALKALLSQADRVGSGLQDTVEDWRSELLHALVEVYQHERLVLEAELYTLRLQHSSTSTEDALKHFDNRLREQEQLHQSGLNAMLRAERQSLLAELDDLHARLVRQRTEQQEQQLRLSEALAKMEEQASNKEWKLQREVQVLEYKLQQEKVIEDDLRKGLEAERRHTTELSAELSRSKAALTSLQSELQTTQIQLSRTKDALEREQQRFTSVTGEWSTCLDALEEERQKNNRLAEMLETLRRQQHNLETELGRKEAIYKERESTESKIIKELRAELASQREQLRKTSESAEKERRERQQAQTAANEAEQTTLTLRHEVDKVQHQTKKVLEGESIKLQELQNMLKQEQHQVTELQESLEDRDSIIARLTREVNKSEDLHGQVQQLQRSLSSTEHHLETERQKVRDLNNLLDKEHEERGSVLQRESELTKQMRSELNALKAETSDVRHQLELETSRAEGLHLELERAQSELRAVTQHSGATERQLQAEQTITWSKLRAAQHEKDELQIKVHQLELELERMQEKLQDLELELDRSHQRELEARHDIERYKLYPSVSPRMAFSDCQAESSDTQMQARLSAFLRQLQAIGDRLQVLVVRQHNHNSATCNVNNSGETIGNKDSCSVESLLQELQVLQGKMSERDQLDGGDFNQIVELEQLKMRVTTLIKEKKELQHRLDLLQNEDNIRTPSKASGTNTTASTSSRQRKQQPVAIPQYLSDAPSDDEAIYERTIWASERLNLQMALDSAEHEIDRLKKELRLFRGRYDAEGFVMEADRDKMQRLYGKYLRAESFRKALVYQKKYLLLLLGGYQDSEQETLAIIATMGGQPSSTLDLAYRRGHRRLYTIFRSAARTVVAIFRMKYLVRKWKRATRVGSPIVSGRVNQQYGYVATPQSFTQPNFVDHPDDHCSTPSATSLYVHTLTRGSSNGNAVSLHSHNPISRLTDDGGASGDYSRVRFNTPPTKEFTHPLRPSSSHLSTSARRPLLHVLDPSENARSSVTADSGVPMGAISGDAAHTFGGGGDDFIQRLENLQSRLSSQNGATPKRPSWR